MNNEKIFKHNEFFLWIQVCNKVPIVLTYKLERVHHFAILKKLFTMRSMRTTYFRAARAIGRVAWMRDRAEIRQISRMARVFWHRAHIVWPGRCISSLYTRSRGDEIGSEWMHPLCRKLFTRQYVCAENEAFKQISLRMCASFCHLCIVRRKALWSRRSERWLFRSFFSPVSGIPQIHKLHPF